MSWGLEMEDLNNISVRNDLGMFIAWRYQSITVSSKHSTFNNLPILLMVLGLL